MSKIRNKESGDVRTFGGVGDDGDDDGAPHDLFSGSVARALFVINDDWFTFPANATFWFLIAVVCPLFSFTVLCGSLAYYIDAQDVPSPPHTFDEAEFHLDIFPPHFYALIV